jgi:hypothetical protein
MVRKSGAQFATKADLEFQIGGVMTEIGGMKSDIRGIKSEMVGMQGEMGGMKGDIRRLMIASLDTNERVKNLQDQVKIQMDTQNSNITRLLEAFGSRMETIWRESIVFPRLIDEQGATLRSHETRITALEARRTP